MSFIKSEIMLIFYILCVSCYLLLWRTNFIFDEFERTVFCVPRFPFERNMRACMFLLENSFLLPHIILLLLVFPSYFCLLSFFSERNICVPARYDFIIQFEWEFVNALDESTFTFVTFVTLFHSLYSRFFRKRFFF